MNMDKRTNGNKWTILSCIRAVRSKKGVGHEQWNQIAYTTDLWLIQHILNNIQ